MKRVRLALVGAGVWGLNYIRAAEESGEATIEKVIKRGDVFEGVNVDAVVIAIPPSESVNLAVKLLARGKPVLIEKPAGLSLRDAERLASAEEQTRGLVLVGHQHLFSEGVERLRRHAESHLSVHADAAFGGPGPVRDYPALWDYGPHAVSAALALLGSRDVVATRAVCGSFVVAGERGHVRCRVGNTWDRKHAQVISYNAGAYDGYASAEAPLTRQVRAFAKAVRDGAYVDWRFGSGWSVDVAKVLEAAGGADGYSRG